MRSWSPSYFSRWCTLWVVYVGLRALLLSLSLKAFCDLLTWGVRSQTRALIAWAGISTTPSGWTAIFLKPCVFFFSSFVSFFHAFFCTWLNNWSNHRAVAWFGFFFVQHFVYCITWVSNRFLSRSVSYSSWNTSCISTLLFLHLLCFQSNMVELFVTVIASTPRSFAVSTIIDKCARLWPLPAFSPFARHFVAFNHAFNWQWSSRWMAVEQETSGMLFLFLWD